MTPRRFRKRALTVVALALVPTLSACGEPVAELTAEQANEQRVTQDPSPTPSSSTDPASPSETTPGPGRIAMSSIELVRVETSGGMCAEGPCRALLTINGDGSWHVVDQDGDRSGRLDMEELTRITNVLFQADATTHPKDKTECASWVDGRDVTLTYTTIEGKPVTVSSCDYDLSRVKLLRVLDQTEGLG